MKTNIRFSNMLLALFLFLVLYSIATYSSITLKITIVVVGLVVATIVCFLFLMMIYIIKRWVQRKILIRQIKQEWFPKRKCIFFLYSSSKKWENYFKTELIPKIQDKSVIWNWSTRYQDGWNSDRFAQRILSLYRPDTHAVPMAVVFLPSGKVKIFKFYTPYIKMIKSGKPDYKNLEEDFLSFVGYFTKLEHRFQSESER